MATVAESRHCATRLRRNARAETTMSEATDPRNESPTQSEGRPTPAQVGGPTPTDDWKRLAYAVAWTQYCHEDDLAQTRTNVSLTIQAALLALLVGLFSPIVEIGRRPLFGVTKWSMGWRRQ